MPGPITSPRRGPARALTAVALAAAVLVTGMSAADDPVAPPEQLDTGIVLVGTSGLYWTDIDRDATPTLWRMVTEGAVGSISVSGFAAETCPTDGWLTLSAGRRVLTADDAADADLLGPAECPALPDVIADGTDEADPGGHSVEGWSALTAPEATTTGSYGTPGTLADRLAGAGACSTAVGPGAALALADGDGHVARYLPALPVVGMDALFACPVAVVHLDEPPAVPGARQLGLRGLDTRLRRVVDALPDGWRIVVAGVSDAVVDEPGLQAVLDWQPVGGTAGWVSSESTRRPGIVTLTDLTATVLDTADAAHEDLDGARLVVGSERRMSSDRTVENRRYLTELTTIVPHMLPVFLGVLALALLTGLAAVRASRRSRLDGRTGPATRRVATAVLLLAAAAPAGAYLAALSRWWGASAPTVAAAVANAVAVTLVAAAAWALSRLLPPGPWRLAGATAGVTWLLLTVDGVTGTVLQHGSLLGPTPTVGARYFGFGNLTFAVYAVAGLVLAGALAAWANRRAVALAAVLAVGLVTVVVDGWPGFGADAGGVLALVPAFVVLLIAVAGARLTLRRVLGTAAATAVTVTVVAVADWARPGPGSHLGSFVQRALDGEAFDMVASKAAQAWATVANPVGPFALAAVVVACVLLVGPTRWRPVAWQRTYRDWPVLPAVVASVVVVTVLGTVLNDSGIAVGVAVLSFAGAVLTGSWYAHRWFPSRAADDVPILVADDAPVRRIPTVLLVTGAALTGALLLVGAAIPGPQVVAGDVPRGPGTAVVAEGDPVVLIGTAGVRWQDVSRAVTPTLWSMVRDGAVVGGVSPGATGAARRCGSAGWLALSAGRNPATGSVQEGTWECVPWGIAAEGGSAQVQGWPELVEVQAASEFRPRLGLLGDTLADADVCTTAIGAGAALALADGDGRLERYLDVNDAVADPATAFACPVTVVDAGGSAHDDPIIDHDAVLRAVDTTVRDVLRAVPEGAVVLVVDVGAPTARPWLGTGLVSTSRSTSTFLSASSTRWEGTVRLLDVPTTVLTAVGVADPPELAGSPLVGAGHRPSDVAETAAQLAHLTERDHALRGIAGSVTSLPMIAALLLLAAAALIRRPATVRRSGRVVEAALLVLAAMPAGLYLMTTWGWWHFDRRGMWAALIVSTLMVAGVAALVPRRPVWAGPALVGGITGAVLTLDAVLGTPLHRGSPLGPAPTLGGRYYGFGNPTYSVYVVAMVVLTAAVATWLLRRGHRRVAIGTTVGLGVVALVVDLWPTLGADIGGGLVLVPAWAVLVLAVAGISVTWGRLLLTGVAGVLAVGAIGAIDWLRPAGDRTHLGRFVESLTDGTAIELIVRKAGYAAASVTGGPTAWLTIAVVAGAALLVWRRSPLRASWFEDLDRHWPLTRPTVLALLIAAVGGAAVNDYGVRIATVMLFSAVPLLGLLVVRLPASGAVLEDVEPDPDVESDPDAEPAPARSAAALPCEGSPEERSTP